MRDLQTKKKLPYACGCGCKKKIVYVVDDPYIVLCDACLQWIHFACEGLKEKPRTKTHICKKCLNPLNL